MDDEEWKNFPVIDGRSYSKYEVSSLGRIRNKRSGHVLSDRPNSKGYVRNEFLDDEGKYKHISAHVIVARAFLGEPKSSDLTPDHINREPADNRLVNLRWATQKQQVANSDRSTCKPRGQPVIQYTMDMKEIKRWINITTAAKGLGIHKGSIGQTCQEKRGHAGGFKWVYERQDLDGEIWKEYIHGTKFHESVEGVTDALSLKPMGAVQVSNMGRIKSSHHIIYGSKIGDYLTYGRPGKFVHVMVAKVFIPNPENKPEVNHLDLDTTNNKVENLEWVTSSENKIHSNKTNSNPDRYSTAKAVNQYISFSSGANVEVLPSFCVGEYRSIGEASRQTKCSQTSIRNVCLGLSESTKGYVFKYADEDVSNLPSTKHVDLIDEDGHVIDAYDNVKAAALDIGISYNSIYEVLGGVRKKTRTGYRFKYH